MRLAHPRSLGALAAGMALVTAGTLALAPHSKANADNCADDNTCFGPTIVNVSARPGAIDLDWSYGIDIPSKVVVYRGNGLDRSVHPEAYAVVLNANVTTDDWGDLAPNHFTDAPLSAGASFRYYVCGQYYGANGLSEDCSDSYSPVVPGNSGGGSSDGSSGGHNGKGTPPPATPKGNPPTKVHAKVRSYQAMEVAWTPPADDWTAVKVTCADQTGGSTCKFPYVTDQPDLRRWEGVVLRADADRNSGGNALIINNLVSGHTYNITVCTLYAVVKTDSCAPVLPVKTLTAPSNLRVLSRDTNAITLGWDDTNDEGVTQYLILRDGALVATRTVASFGVSSPVQVRLNPAPAGFVHADVFGVVLTQTYRYTICPQHVNESQEFALGDVVACASVEALGVHAGVQRLQGPPIHPTLP